MSIDAHPSIYKPENRKLDVYFSEPECGVNDDTGILLFIDGYVASADSLDMIILGKH
ncbi:MULTISPECIES: hypothetical protein [Clostridium]|uniref:hypothetical protein n=1 Tax=Clostridium TaxID=1485 RepID=UPI0012FD7EFB|nr:MULTISPECIES: hypothetical protein [Clostridium]